MVDRWGLFAFLAILNSSGEWYLKYFCICFRRLSNYNEVDLLCIWFCRSRSADELVEKKASGYAISWVLCGGDLTNLGIRPGSVLKTILFYGLAPIVQIGMFRSRRMYRSTFISTHLSTTCSCIFCLGPSVYCLLIMYRWFWADITYKKYTLIYHVGCFSTQGVWFVTIQRPISQYYKRGLSGHFSIELTWIWCQLNSCSTWIVLARRLLVMSIRTIRVARIRCIISGRFVEQSAQWTCSEFMTIPGLGLFYPTLRGGKKHIAYSFRSL